MAEVYALLINDRHGDPEIRLFADRDEATAEARLIAREYARLRVGQQPLGVGHRVQEGGAVRGYFGVGVWKPKAAVNVGTLWRSCQCFGASFFFTIRERFPEKARINMVRADPALGQPGDTTRAWRHVPYLAFEDLEDLRHSVPLAKIVAVETGVGEPPDDLFRFEHPSRAIYLLGAEDGGIPREVLAGCDYVVEIPSSHCLNVAVAGSIVIYDRCLKQHFWAQQEEL
jgi:tRNA(Leu) C34 or U34 (ribose-2'-O)-methylase TrmL